jgi:hypothetical protein
LNARHLAQKNRPLSFRERDRERGYFRKWLFVIFSHKGMPTGILVTEQHRMQLPRVLGRKKGCSDVLCIFLTINLPIFTGNTKWN